MNVIRIVTVASLTGALLFTRAEAQSADAAQAARSAMAEWTKARNYAAPAGAPYGATDVTITTPAGIKLTGTLTMPLRRSGRIGAVITVTGSGGQDRDGAQPGMRDYQPFREIADTLSRRGIAVLRLDDRGMGGSDLGPMTVTTADFANDIRAGIEWLRSRPDIDPARIAVVGHSEGGIIAPMIAATDSTLAGIVIMAGTASTGRVILKRQQEYAVDSMAKLTGPVREAALAHSARAADSLAAAMPWFGFFVNYDPVPTARKVRPPVLILHGDRDRQVPVEDADRLASVIREAGNGRVVVARSCARITSSPTTPMRVLPTPNFRPCESVARYSLSWSIG